MKSAAPAIAPAVTSIPELRMRPAEKAAAVMAMAIRTTTSSRARRPEAAVDLEVMTCHTQLRLVPLPGHHAAASMQA